MLNNPQDVIEFKEYQSAGGLQKPFSYEEANKAIALAETVNNAFIASVDNDLDYVADGIQELPEIITALGGEAGEAGAASMALKTYLDLSANPTDLEQVSIGVDIICKLAGTANDKPALSITPITDPTAITSLVNKLTLVDAQTATITDLMAKINEAITPPPAPIPPAKTPTLPPPPLPDDLKTQAMALIDVLKPLKGSVITMATTVDDLAKNATVEREKAIKAFNDAIAFTLLKGQKSKPSVSAAANELYPA
ncbi:hypothetical protein [Photobacterium leiognathi]|uniref:hypothetical protein n=1 Tax=Photobacterium leiognathi TaxID=553611 RepID=UPI00298283E2|nr:hypothetical protein [Photobacterium leiognathi]